MYLNSTIVFQYFYCEDESHAICLKLRNMTCWLCGRSIPVFVKLFLWALRGWSDSFHLSKLEQNHKTILPRNIMVNILVNLTQFNMSQPSAKYSRNTGSVVYFV